MKIVYPIIIIIILIALGGCSEEEVNAPEGIVLCGDRVCDVHEQQKGNCPKDCIETEKPEQETERLEKNIDTENNEKFQCPAIETEQAWTNPVDYEKISETTETFEGIDILVEDYSVINPTSNAELEVTIYSPNDSNIYPAVILIPGGLGDKSHFEDKYISKQYASEGFIVLIFSPDGRAESTGEENYNGHIQQDGLYEMYRFLKDYERTESVGIASFSYGVALASGMIARYQPDIDYYIEWEGPVDRNYVTFQCRKFNVVEEGVDCANDEYWKEREAMCFVPYFPNVPFIVVQRAEDHAQPTVQHAVDINNKAIQYLDWVRVNGPENAINIEYTAETLPVIEDTLFDSYIIEYMKELTS